MATFGLSGSLRLAPSWSDALGSSTLSDATTFLNTFSLANGTGVGQANAYWRDVRTVAANTVDTIETFSLPLSVLGGSGSMDLNAAKMRMLYVRNLSELVNLGLVFDAERIPVSAGGLALFNWPADPEAGAGDFLSANGGELLIRNDTATSAQYEILLIGILST